MLLTGIRPAEKRDLVYLRMICAEGGLALIESFADTSVAVNDEDIPVGFIHIETITDDANPAANGVYVYPVAVFEAWRHRGVARALVEHAARDAAVTSGELKLVACKPSRGFYPKVGFEPVGWDLIAARIAKDCELCADRKACAPVPFARNQPSNTYLPVTTHNSLLSRER
jgi:N-acetylglutamate synthase-like GNAT family acetyltransferase